jgi:hypothetical protein
MVKDDNRATLIGLSGPAGRVDWREQLRASANDPTGGFDGGVYFDMARDKGQSGREGVSKSKIVVSASAAPIWAGQLRGVSGRRHPRCRSRSGVAQAYAIAVTGMIPDTRLRAEGKSKDAHIQLDRCDVGRGLHGVRQPLARL